LTLINNFKRHFKSKQSSCSLLRQVDNYIIDKVIHQLPDNYRFIDTWGITPIDVAIKQLTQNETAVCYAGVDWENTNCLDIRKQAHALIQEKSKNQIYIGNHNGKYYFSFWVEFIRQNSAGYFNTDYDARPNIEKVFLSYNRHLPHHRIYFLKRIDQTDLANIGILSRGDLQNRIPEDIYTLGDPNIWNKFFVNVVTETICHSDVLLSEKTWKPIIGLRPFLILGDRRVYEKLHELGFDTFDDIFGEWWKNPDEDWHPRVDSIIDILTNFERDLSNLNKLYEKIFPRLLANKHRFKEYMIENHDKICNLGI
jgi:hypothetical protein